MDSRDDEVYQYDTSGNLTGSFELDGDNDSAAGLATDGSEIWVVDKKDDLVYEYDLSGNLTGSFALDPANKNAEGITATSTHIWVVDRDVVYQYTVEGASLGTDYTLSSANGVSTGSTGLP